MENREHVRCLIVGSGPAGYTAAIYAGRANLSPVEYCGIQTGGQLTQTTVVENFPGYPEGVDGNQMMQDLRQQASGTDESIHQFCKLNYGTEFPRFKKVKVNGDDADDLFKFLKEQKSFAGFDPAHKLTPVLEEMLAKDAPDYKETADIKWNFTKFLVNKRGMVVARFEPTESLDNIAKQIEEII